MIHTDGTPTIANGAGDPPKSKNFNLMGAILRYENGDLGEDETLDLFQRLVDNGLAWRLQGSYGRMAAMLIEAGLIKFP